jgi:hypothetical protein
MRKIQKTLGKTAIRSSLLAALVPAVAAAAITPTGSPITIQPNTLTNIYFDSVAKNASGAFAVTWLEFLANGPEVLHAASFDALGNPVAAPFVVETGNLVTPPSIAINTSGQFVISWITPAGDPNTTNRFVYTQAFDTNGTPLSAVVSVADVGTVNIPQTNDGFYGAALSMADNGNYLVSWDHDVNSYTYTGTGCSSIPVHNCTENETFQYTTYAQVYSADGTSQLGPITVYQSPELTSSFNPNYGAPASGFHYRKLQSAAMDASGGFSIAYDGVSGAYSTINLARFNADGSVQSQTAVGKVNSKYSASGAVLTRNAAGQAVVAWGQYKSPIQGYQVTSYHLQRIKSDGSKNGLAAVLKAGTIANGEASNNYSAYLPTLSMDASGNYAFGWVSNRIDNGAFSYSAWVQPYLANGAVNGAPVELTTAPRDLNLGIDSDLRPVVLEMTGVPQVSNTIGLQAQQYTGP